MTDETLADGARSPRSSVAPGTSALPAELWQAVLEGWDEPKRHDALLRHCQTSAQLAAAASNYRALLNDPERSGLAETQLKRIAATAMAQMEVSRATEIKTPRRRLFWLLFWVFSFVAATVWVLRQISVP
jgi:hypothetical protein